MFRLRPILVGTVVSSMLVMPMPAGAAQGDAKLGTNLSDTADWQTQFSFVDVFKAARTWIPQHDPYDGIWDTGESIATDEHGWVTELAPGQAAANVVVTEQGGNYPAGEYIFLYDGQGTVEFHLDGQIVSEQPGRIVVQITPSDGGLTWLRITETNPADPLRNIRFIMPGFEDTYQQQVFHPAFLDSLSIYEVLRFMDWQNTDDTELAEWSDRTTLQTFSQATEGGVALEHMIDLCNRLQKHPWFCMPHRASDDFITQFATFVRDHLDPSLNIYIEYSNEVWNGIFPQHYYAQQQGLAMGLSDDPWLATIRFHSLRSVQMFGLWENVFGGADRIVRVMGGWADSSYTNEEILDFQEAWQHTDALGTAPYFPRELDLSVQELEQMTVDQLVDYVEARIHESQDIPGMMADNHVLTEARGIGHITYEGGQHLVDFEHTDNDVLTALFVGANRHPRMRELYDYYLRLWHQQSGGGLMTHFTHIGSYGRYGSWGSLEKQTQDPATAPKWLALIDYRAWLDSMECPADLTEDGEVDIEDVFVVLANWGMSDVPADMNEDGEVDIDDLFEVFASWGPCP